MSEAFSDPAAEEDLLRAREGDGDAFARLVQPLRRELHVHCYRMLGSTHDAEDALQDALLRAWKGLNRFEGRSSLRTWLYTVVTRTCLDTAALRGRRALPIDLGPSSEHAVINGAPQTDIAWLSPYPDTEASYEQREGIELAFIAACQHLPGNQRAVLLLFEVLGFTVAEIASMMDTTTTAVNSALARARKLVAKRVPPRQTIPVEDAHATSRAFADALERGDAQALVVLLTEDVMWSMPPYPHWYQGIDAAMDFALEVPIKRCPNWSHRIVTANGQPAVAGYLKADNDDHYEAWSITVLTLRDGRIADITSFIGAEHFIALGLPTRL